MWLHRGVHPLTRRDIASSLWGDPHGLENLGAVEALHRWIQPPPGRCLQDQGKACLLCIQISPDCFPHNPDVLIGADPPPPFFTTCLD